MREIKFRVWSNREMRFPPTLGEWDDSDNHHFFGYNKKPSVIMQYTGLKDKNGKEIWEGDIVQLGSHKTLRAVIEWSDCSFVQRWLNKNIRTEIDMPAHHTGAESIFQNAHISLEVIGNIYENKELLNALHQ